MNCLLNPTTDAELNKYDTHAETSSLEDIYATAPMAVLNSAGTDLSCPPEPLTPVGKRPVTQTLSFEEEVYSEFEQAISGRLEEVQLKLQSISASSPRVVPKPSNNTKMSARLSNINWQHILFFGAFAFIFTLLGFDAMGLLVLFSR
jgi:hypothetical protein